MAYPPPSVGARTDESPGTPDAHAQDHTDLDARVDDVVTELGANPSGGSADVTVRLAALDTTVSGKALGSDLTAEATTRASADTTEATARAAADTAEAAARAAADALLIPLTQKGANNGVASLDSTGKVPPAQIPSAAISDYLGDTGSQAAMLLLSSAGAGDWTNRTDVSKSFIFLGGDYTQLANWKEILTPADAVSSVNSRTGTVTGLAEQSDLANETATRAAADTALAGSVVDLDDRVTAVEAGKLNASAVSAFGLTLVDDANAAAARATVGLGNVDNTADTAKPVSTSQQTALDLKAPLADPALTGNPTAPTQTQGNSSTRLATTAFVNAEIAADAAPIPVVDTAANFAANNPVLAAKQLGKQSDAPYLIAVGDGSTGWNTLPKYRPDRVETLDIATSSTAQNTITTEVAWTDLQLSVDADGVSDVMISVYIPKVTGASTGDTARVFVYEGATLLGTFDTGRAYTAGAELGGVSMLVPLLNADGRRPTAATHTYDVKVKRQVGTGSVSFTASASTKAMSRAYYI